MQGRWKDGLVCLQCPAGQEPTKVRGSEIDNISKYVVVVVVVL